MIIVQNPHRLWLPSSLQTSTCNDFEDEKHCEQQYYFFIQLGQGMTDRQNREMTNNTSDPPDSRGFYNITYYFHSEADVNFFFFLKSTKSISVSYLNQNFFIFFLLHIK